MFTLITHVASRYMLSQRTVYQHQYRYRRLWELTVAILCVVTFLTSVAVPGLCSSFVCNTTDACICTRSDLSELSLLLRVGQPSGVTAELLAPSALKAKSSSMAPQLIAWRSALKDVGPALKDGVDEFGDVAWMSAAWQD